MQILTSREALETAAGSQHVGYMGIAKKGSADSLHAGHEALVTYAKANCDIVVVNLWDTLEMVNEIYPRDWFATDITVNWDGDGCLAWCDNLGVDYVLVPPAGYSKTYLSNIGLVTSAEGVGAGYTFVDGVWAANGYTAYDIDEDENIGASRLNATLMAKSFVMLQNYKTALNQTYVTSWKDGFPRFTMADYVNNHTAENFILLDPIKTPDNLYYSSSYPNFTQTHKNAILQFESIVNSTGYSDTAALKVALNNAVSSSGITVTRIDTTIGGVVGANNDFINILFSTDTDLGDNYPIYKKGVRP